MLTMTNADGTRLIRVMLVDNQTLILDGFARIVDAQPDMSVIATATDGETAIRTAHQAKPDVILMDVRMPGLTGIEAQAVMNERGFSLPVIFLTGHGDIDMAVMALHEGAADFIQKPVDNERLLAVIASTAFESLSGAGAVLDGETARARCAELTNRERDIARLVAEGLTNRLIGERLSIAVRTVEVHRASALRKLGVRTPEEVRAVLEAGA